MSHERLEFPLDRETVLRKYDELCEVGCTDPSLAAPRVGVTTAELVKVIDSRREMDQRRVRNARQRAARAARKSA
jgi:hypothetical protein